MHKFFKRLLVIPTQELEIHILNKEGILSNIPLLPAIISEIITDTNNNKPTIENENISSNEESTGENINAGTNSLRNNETQNEH